VDPDRLQRLCDERDIQRALTLFARAMDDRDWTAMADILADDAEGDFGTGRLYGSAAIIELIRSFLDSCGPTQHLLGNVIIDVDGDKAVSRAYIRDVHLRSDAARRRGSIPSATTKTHGGDRPTSRGA
jgi:SnoaL-like domain